VSPADRHTASRSPPYSIIGSSLGSVPAQAHKPRARITGSRASVRSAHRSHSSTAFSGLIRTVSGNGPRLRSTDRLAVPSRTAPDDACPARFAAVPGPQPDEQSDLSREFRSRQALPPGRRPAAGNRAGRSPAPAVSCGAVLRSASPGTAEDGGRGREVGVAASAVQQGRALELRANHRSTPAYTIAASSASAVSAPAAMDAARLRRCRVAACAKWYAHMDVSESGQASQS
jgi:hypothetical protein